MINTFAELIDRFGGPAKFGRAVGMSPGAAKQAKRRNRVAVTYFPAVAQAAQDRDIQGVTVKKLVEMATGRGDRAA